MRLPTIMRHYRRTSLYLAAIIGAELGLILGGMG